MFGQFEELLSEELSILRDESSREKFPVPLDEDTL